MASLISQMRNGAAAITPQQMSPQISNIKMLMNSIKMSLNPQLALATLVAQNPLLANLMLSGMSPEQIARDLAKKLGVDIDLLIRWLLS